MDILTLVDQIVSLLQQRGRVTYGVLMHQFGVDKETLATLKEELFFSYPQVREENGRGLVWVGDEKQGETGKGGNGTTEEQVTGRMGDPATIPHPPVNYTPSHLAERIRAATVTDGERKTITALFADLKGSTALIEGLDPEEARAIIDPALQLMMDAVHRYEGYVAQALGDGIFALFGAPIAHEDHPQRALYAALRMQEEMHRYGDQIRLKHGVPLAMRIGINTGEVVVRSIRKDDLHADYVPVGHSTNLAARMEQMATPGSILVTVYTQKLTEGYFAFKALGQTQIKQELMLQVGLGAAVLAIRGLSAPQLESVYTRARELCRQVGETPELSSVLAGLAGFHLLRAEFTAVSELGEQILTHAQKTQDPLQLTAARWALGTPLFWRGELVAAREQLEQGIALYLKWQPRYQSSLEADSMMFCLFLTSYTLWHLGYPDQALKRNQEGLALAREIAHPHGLATSFNFACRFYQFCREARVTQERAEALMSLASEQGFVQWLALGTFHRGWTLTEQGHMDDGIAQMEEGLSTYRANGTKLGQVVSLALLAEKYEEAGRVEEGVRVLAEAITVMNKTEERNYEAELYRLKGELTLQQCPQPLTPSTQAEAEQEAEGYFLKAIAIAQQQHAKSLELRAVMSFVRLRQHQTDESVSRNTQHESRAKLVEAHRMLSDIYQWFTEGFDTRDLQEAKGLLEELVS